MENQLPEEVLEEVKEDIEKNVRSGFYNSDEIIERVLEAFEDADPEALESIVPKLVREAIDAQLEEQANWTETDCDKLDAAFAELEEKGIVMRQNFSCCGTCGSAEIWEEVREYEESGKKARGYAFYHNQDTEHAVEGYGICLNYGATENDEEKALAIATEIAETVSAKGLKVKWNGAWNQRVSIDLDWKRRFEQ